MIFAHATIIQEGEAILFYNYNRKLSGYMIAGIIISPNTKARMCFAKVWRYFASEVVRGDDIYCSIALDKEDSMFINFLKYYGTIKGLRIYKVDNSLKEQYSSYQEHKKIITERAKLNGI
jgi:hypothetical protein